LGWTIYQTGPVAMMGALVGGLAAWWILSYYSRQINGKRLSLWHKPVTSTGENTAVLSASLKKRFFLEGGLLTIYSGYLILFQLADSFLIDQCAGSGGDDGTSSPNFKRDL